MARLIAVANMKGGVGKTATVIGLAETLAAHSLDRSAKTGSLPRSVLVVDLDAQASASFALAGPERLLELIHQGATFDGFLESYLVQRKEVSLVSYITHQVSDVSHRGLPLRVGLLAASPGLRTVERSLIHSLTRGGYSLERIEHDLYMLLSAQLQAVGRAYDYVIFDCPPGISLLTEIALRLADITLVPTIPDFLSLLGLDAFTQSVWTRLSNGRNGLPAPASVPHVLLTKRKNTPSHDRRAAELRRRVANGKAGCRVFASEIPEAEGVVDALERVTRHPSYARKWNAEIRSHLSGLASEVEGLLVVDAHYARGGAGSAVS
jgi:cellulose biosynthesis protein BcsQ